jgi:tetratricopeptide (TPR) repeat protein
VALAVAQALAEVDDPVAAAAFRALAGSRFAADARRALTHLDARAGGGGEGQGLPPGLLAGPADETAAAARTALTDLFDAARGGNWDDAIASLRDGPPHEGAAGSATLHAAALLAEGRGKQADAGVLEAAALAAAGGDPDAVAVSGLAHIADGDGKASSASPRSSWPRRASRSTRRRSRWRTSNRGWPVWPMDAADGDRAADRWRAALAVDPSCLQAARALRRDAARRGDLAMAVDATKRRPPACTSRSTGSTPCCWAAALAEDAARGEPGGVPHRRRAMALLRSVLEIEPGHEGAFEQLRTLLAETEDAMALAATLASRIAVAANPFEVTSLPAARAPSCWPGSWVTARARARAGRDPAEAARAPARAGAACPTCCGRRRRGPTRARRICGAPRSSASRRRCARSSCASATSTANASPMRRRAIAAYERVRGIEPDNREALHALSELYVAENDHKQALPVTERLVATEPTRRSAPPTGSGWASS